MYIKIEEARTILEKRAYDWAVKEQERMDCTAEPISLELESDFLTTDRGDFVASVFYNRETKSAILRRDWFDDMSLKYNTITNFDEIKEIAPKSVARLLHNAIELYHYYDGPAGGVTRRMKKEWGFSKRRAR